MITGKVGLVLSGGGARGIAHLGLIKAMEEHKIPIDMISGTSAGAIIGALYASGHSTETILGMIKSVSTYQLLSPAYSLKGVLKIEVLMKFLRKYIGKDSFEALQIPLTVAATNINRGVTDFFSTGEMYQAICASACIPVLFHPVEWKGYSYIDGGILNNLPVEPLISKCDVIVASHTNPIMDEFQPRNARQVMERALMMSIVCNVEVRKEKCDHFIEPSDLGGYNVLDLRSADDIFEKGYAAASEYFQRIGY
ncbi:patatin-like phospholipase family protein [Fulvivirga sedimenti]|uniref:Patatin-like phospholipase family protein n=1 Tax=Fulvivirga sedimenti TaxID=2879465 RepID=A0A9X1HV44_9BACT|nr:patatin-like phospholipase family protein [Fulvivirga sedimenti]MCA6078849.1 patatin-like phospholipase family protein [Fulvivirga sedimenti]